jgi:hypothetical protein
MLRRIRAALRGERGEASAVSIVLGTLLFLTASAGSVAVVGNIMAATAVTRQNSIIESALQQQLQDFESSSFEASTQTYGPTTSTVQYGGLSIPVTTWQYAFSTPSVFIHRVTAPMATVGGKSPASCATQTITPPAGCMSFFATRTPTPQDDTGAYAAGLSTLRAFPGITVGSKTVNAAQNALTILNIDPLKVLTADPVRVQVALGSGAPAANSINYGFFCGTSATPVATFVGTSQTYLTDKSVILELNPSTLKSVAGCTSATVGLWTSSAVAPSAVGNIYWWRILPVKGASE